MDWRNIDYLRTGTPRQNEAFDAICNSNILKLLRPYDPAVVSTICIDIDINTSDIDIICQVDNIVDFSIFARSAFGQRKNFNCHTSGNSTLVFSFEEFGFEFEVYGATTPIEEQNGYRHLSVMARLLHFGGRELRNTVRKRKSEGLKSEASFCQSLGISGDPYSELLNLEKLSDRELSALVRDAGFRSFPSSLSRG